MADNEKVIAVDCDGCITESGGTPPGVFAPVRTGTRAFLGALRDRGYKVVIFSARTPTDAVKQFFLRNDLHRFVNGYTRVKPRNARIFLDDRGIQFRGDYSAALKEIDSFKPHWEKVHDYGYAGIALPAELTEKVRALGERIPDDHLDPEDGREKDAHVTALYGFTEDDPGKLVEAVRGFGPVKGKLGNLSLFENPGKDVLKLDVDSEDLHRLRRQIAGKVPHVETHANYIPHATVAYLKPGRGSEHLMLENPLRDQEFTVSELEFSDRAGKRTTIPL